MADFVIDFLKMILMLAIIFVAITVIVFLVLSAVTLAYKVWFWILGRWM